MNPESIDNEKHVVDPEMLETTPLKEVESLGGISQEKEHEMMHPQEVAAKEEAHQEKIAEVRKGIFAKLKESFFGNKEVNLAKDVNEDIKSLTITKVYDAGLGGLGNMSTNALREYERMISKYNLGEDGIHAFEQVRALSSEISQMQAGPEKVAKTEELNSAKGAFFASMRDAAEKK